MVESSASYAVTTFDEKEISTGASTGTNVDLYANNKLTRFKCDLVIYYIAEMSDHLYICTLYLYLSLIHI